ncbi:peptidase S41 [Phormidium tenue FACHB-886]|nr:peptidase S41 [Phormidium tenue FACHB-886]
MPFLPRMGQVQAEQAQIGQAQAEQAQEGQTQAEVFEQVWQTVNDNFFDPRFNGVDWQAMRQKYAPLAEQARSNTEFAAAINQMLAELKTSHTRYYTPDDPAYYQLLGIFLPRSEELQEQLKPLLPTGKPEYSGIGAFTKIVDGNTFISAILEGSPAEQAGLRVGDRLLSAMGQPFQPIQSFATGQPVTLQIQRSADASPQDITVTPKQLDGTKMFLEAMDASVQVIEQGDREIGYIHIWSYADDEYQQKLESELLFGRLRSVDGFVLDLRDGWGGASPTYLNLYGRNSLSLTSISRDETRRTSQSVWTKPVVMLVNEGSRSGKEILAYGFRKHNIGKIVGTKTAGAVVGGSPFLMSDGSLLYLAVVDVYLDDGQRLEGVGVAPDVEVPFTLEYAQGADPQKERAIAVVSEQIK